MSKYKIKTSLVNETEGHIFSEWDEDLEDWLLKVNGTPDTGAIYRLMQRGYGRCQSSVYVDTQDGGTVRTGWYFVSRERYEDTGESYLRGAWVTLEEVIAPMVPETRQAVSV